VTALLDGSARGLIESRVRTIEKIETAVEPEFQAHFVNAMGIPNSVEIFTELAKEVTLPALETPSESQSAESERRRNRRRSRGS
jgi:uncharacterized 2Fe-2S/4Fe-4S cluster protein (DUF4445 family)